MSSLSGMVGVGGFMAYTASKGAVRLMTKDAALEFAGDQVRVNSVHPGYVDTAMLDRLFEQWGQSKEDAVRAAVPAGWPSQRRSPIALRSSPRTTRHSARALSL